MTVNPEGDLASPDCVRCLARYSDGGVDAFAIPKATLQQGPEEGWPSIARIMLRNGRMMGISARER
jgi:hypothetical protein